MVLYQIGVFGADLNLFCGFRKKDENVKFP
jgi:hypothetical protein